MDCRIRDAADWSTRANHEAQQHQRNCFLTLTFSEDGLALRELQRGTHPFDLDVRDWQGFAKRLRQELLRQQRRMEKKLGLPKCPAPKLRFFHVGEYGEEKGRPHYHALIFGQDFTGEGERWIDENGNPKWRSATVEKCWPYGFAELGDLAPESVNYVCSYVQKKLHGPMKEAYLERLDLTTGECVTVKPEYATMSRNPGIGNEWWKKWKTDTFPDDFVVLAGKKAPVPKYYTRLLKKEDETLYEQIREAREKSAAGRAADNTPERRAVRGKVTKAKMGLKRKRSL